MNSANESEGLSVRGRTSRTLNSSVQSGNTWREVPVTRTTSDEVNATSVKDSATEKRKRRFEGEGSESEGEDKAALDSIKSDSSEVTLTKELPRKHASNHSTLSVASSLYSVPLIATDKNNISALNPFSAAVHITDVIVVAIGEKPPQNYASIRYVGDSSNSAAGLGRTVQIWVERSPSKPPITGLCVYFPNRGEFPPPGFTPAQSTRASAGDINVGSTSSSRALLAICRGDGAPILDIGICSTTHVPANWTGVERSPLGFKAIIGQRITRATSANSALGTGGGSILCVKYDLTDVSKFRENDMVRYGQSEGEASISSHGTRPRKSSLIGHVFTSVTPNVNPLRKTVLSRRSTASSLASPMGSKKQPMEPPSPTLSTNSRTSGDDNGGGNRGGFVQSSVILTRLQRARERALAKCRLDEGLGMSGLAFDPEVAGLLMNADHMEKVVTALSNIVRGSVLDALLSLRELGSMIRSSEVLPSVPFQEQMTVFDFIIAMGASTALERGLDILVAAACRIVVEGGKAAANGLHPVALHHSLSVLLRSHEFFSRVREDFMSQKAQALMQESYQAYDMSNSSAPSGSDSPNPGNNKPERVASTDRLDSLVARISGFGFTGSPAPPPLPSGSPMVSYLHHDPPFHFLVPAETAELLLSDRTFVLVQAPQTFFQDVVDRSLVFLRQESNVKTDETNLNAALETISRLTLKGPFLIEATLEAYLVLSHAFEHTCPIVDLLLCIAWVCAYTSANPEMKSILIQDLLIRSSRIDIPVVGLFIRRLVFPMALRRTSHALQTPGGDLDDAFSLLSCMWRHFRVYLKAEFAVAMHFFIAPSLRSNRTPSPIRRRIIDLISSWLDADRACLVEMFVNFELESPIQHWTVFQELFDALCQTARSNALSKLSSQSNNNKTTSSSGGGGVSSASTSSAVKKKKSSVLQRNNSSFESSDGGEDEDQLLAHVQLEAATTLVTCMRQLVNLSGTVKLTSAEWNRHEDFDKASLRKLEEEKVRETLARALQISKAQGSAKSAVSFLIAAGYLQETPQAVAQFLRVHLTELGEMSVGDYLGEGGKSSTEQAFMVALRDAYVKGAPRNGNDTLDQALRRYLTSGGFRLPGEGQKVERLIEAFARRYCADHPDMDMTEEGVLLLAFSVVMLNTDLHKPQIKQKAKMKKEDFIRNVSGINGGKDFPREFLSDLYDSIARNEIRFPKSSSMTSFSDNENGGGGGSSMTAEDVGEGDDESGKEKDASIGGIQLNIERGLSILDTLGDRNFSYDSTMTPDYVRSIFESISPKIFQIVSIILEDNSARYELVSAALEMLEYAIGITLFLESPGSERRAFASLLAKLSVLYGLEPLSSLSSSQEGGGLNRQARDELVLQGHHLQLGWFLELMKFDHSTMDAGLAITEVHDISLRIAEKMLARHQEQKLLLLATRLGYPELASSNSERTFIREGPLRFRYNREKILFLFSDCLIRADYMSNGKLRIEENLPLRTLRVFDEITQGEGVSASDADCAFEIRSPLSSFVLLATSKREKDMWVRSINQALLACAENLSRIDSMRSPMSKSTTSKAAVARSPPLPASSLRDRRRNSSPVIQITPVKSNGELGNKKSPVNEEVLSPITVPVGGRVPASPVGQARSALFAKALSVAKKMLLDDTVETPVKLLVYGYFKQATKGDCLENDPPADVIRRAKWHAWRAHHGMTKEEARSAFVKVIARESRSWTNAEDDSE